MKNQFHKGWIRILLLILFISSQSFATRHPDLLYAVAPIAHNDYTTEDFHARSTVCEPGLPANIDGLKPDLQQQSITGRVTFAGMPLVGATIGIRGGAAIAISDENGNYSIAAGPSDILVFSYTGFKTIEVAVNGQLSINTEMTEDAAAIEEVTVNAGYYRVKDRERTGSISKISAADIERQPVANVLATMQGQMPGVNIIQETGVPGGGFNISIRGLNSLRRGANEPLYIIDGVPYTAESAGYEQTSTVLPGSTSPLNSINPTDIESIEVLKDADATAIYGSRGANGVVLITTKRGKAGKTAFSFSTLNGYGKVTRFMDLMNTPQYLAMRAEAYANDGITEYPATAYDINGTWSHDRYTDWQKELLGGTASILHLQASVSGGSETTRFLVSANHRKEGTVFAGDSQYNKGGLHLSLNHRSLNERFRFAFTGGYTTQDNDQPATDLTREALLLPPNAPELYDDAGNLNWENSTWTNPLRYLNGKFRAKTKDLVANAVISYELLQGLEAKTSLGYTNLINDETRTSPSTLYDPAYNLTAAYSSVYSNKTTRDSWIIEPQLSWAGEFGRSRAELLVGGSFQEQLSDRMFQSGFGFTSNSLIYDLASASTQRVLLDALSKYRYQAFFGRINYNWDQRYIVNITARRDGSSRFGPGKQFANFGAVGAAWIFSNESLFEGQTTLSFGKLRASYGIAGSDQIGDYQYLDTYTSSGTTYQGAAGLEPTRLFNPDFGWETNRKLEVALEAGIFADRLFLTAAWYRNRSGNQLVGLPLPATTGFTSMQANLDATVENTGTELSIRSVNVKGKEFNWVSSLNLTVPRNKLLSFPGLESSAYADTYVVGESINIVKLYHFTGVDPQTGVYTFEDVNGDGSISYGDDNKTIKNLSPRFFGGFQSQLSYKRVQLDFLFHFVKQENYNWASVFTTAGGMNNQPVPVTDSWSQPGDNAPHQLFTSGLNDAASTAFSRYAASDAAVSDASFIRLKNVALSYDLPDAWTKGIGCRIYFQGQNLLTFTRYKGADPEFRTIGYLPPLKVVSVGLQLNL